MRVQLGAWDQFIVQIAAAGVSQTHLGRGRQPGAFAFLVDPMTFVLGNFPGEALGKSLSEMEALLHYRLRQLPGVDDQRMVPITR